MDKWVNDHNIDIETSIGFYNHLAVIDSQKICVIKFKYEQYKGIVYKQLFFGQRRFLPSHVP